MKRYTHPFAAVIEMTTSRGYAGSWRLSEDEGDDQWSRKKSDNFGKEGVGGKLWEDMK